MKKIAIAAILAAFVAPSAFASNAYIGINVGKNQMGYSDVSSSTAYSLMGGYSFSDNMAAEVAYTSFGSADMTSTSYKVTGNAMSVAAVGSILVGNNVFLFGKLGVAMTKMEVADAPLPLSESKSSLVYGFGAQFDVSNSVGFRLGYDSYKVGSTDPQSSNLISLGVLFKF